MGMQCCIFVMGEMPAEGLDDIGQHLKHPTSMRDPQVDYYITLSIQTSLRIDLSRK